MKAKIAIAFLAVILFSTLGCVEQPGDESAQPGEEFEGGGLMKLLSNDLEQGKEIPSEFTCDGANVSPELHWEGALAETKSFALTVRDPDAPMGTFDHWLVCNISASVSSISKGGPIPQGATQIQNDFGKLDYGGPCPPSGTHRYFFKLYALDVESIDCSNKQELFNAIEAHKIDEAELMAPYQRK